MTGMGGMAGGSQAGGGQADAYLRTKVLTARPEELRLMLLDGSIRFATQGREGLSSKNYEQSFEGLSQARDIILELITGIAPTVDPELAGRVRGLYTFLYTELVQASFEKDVGRVDKVIELLRYERETWALFIERLRKEGPTAAMPAPTSVHATQDAGRGTPRDETPAGARAPLSLEA